MVHIAGHHEFFKGYLMLPQKLFNGLTLASGRNRKELHAHEAASPKKLLFTPCGGYFVISDVIFDLQSAFLKNTRMPKIL
jgi:hypothetical protein